jgi:MFS family permease
VSISRDHYLEADEVQRYTFIVTTAISRGLSQEMAFYLVPILNASSVFGRIIPGMVADKTGPMNMYLFCSTVTLLSTAAIWIPVSGTAGMVMFAIVFGFGSGGMNALSPAIVASISDVKSIGLRMGLCYTFTGIGW